jgi:two-component system, cell cycle response regulator DivK
MPTILLVEDNTNNTSLLEDVFAYDNIPARLATTTNGEDCLSLAAALRPVLILMDLRLPGIDGLETTELLKRNAATKDIPVWAITAYALPGEEEQALAIGCAAYFARPLSMRALADRLLSFLHNLEKTESQEPCLNPK